MIFVLGFQMWGHIPKVKNESNPDGGLYQLYPIGHYIRIPRGMVIIPGESTFGPCISPTASLWTASRWSFALGLAKEQLSAVEGVVFEAVLLGMFHLEMTCKTQGMKKKQGGNRVG